MIKYSTQLNNTKPAKSSFQQEESKQSFSRDETRSTESFLSGCQPDRKRCWSVGSRSATGSRRSDAGVRPSHLEPWCNQIQPHITRVCSSSELTRGLGVLEGRVLVSFFWTWRILEEWIVGFWWVLGLGGFDGWKGVNLYEMFYMVWRMYLEELRSH